MCGIIGYIGNKNSIDILKNGLKALEYRGYDSAGICVFDGHKFATTKKTGTVDNLFDNLNTYQNSHMGIGHTRWATHGKTTTENSHPHTSFFGNVTIVHNGIIENYQELLNSHLAGIKLKSQTDTEIICNLIEKYYFESKNHLQAIKQTIKILKGSYALGIIFDDDKENIYFAKHFSPLLIGIGKDEHFLSSDTLGFCKYTSKFVEIEDNCFGKISKSNISVFDGNNNLVFPREQFVDKDRQDVDKDGYPYFMLKEINETPKIILDTVNFYQKNKVFEKINPEFFKDINRIKLIACGTSYHACLAGEILLNKIGYDVSSHIASEFIYSDSVLNEKTLCIFISQSGETADTLSAIKIAKSKGAKTIAITNVLTSTITKLCDFILPIKCGAEIAVASTKAYVGQIVALFLMSTYLSNKKNYTKTIKNLKQFASSIDIKNLEQQIKLLVKEVIGSKNIFMVGRQTDYVSSLESALKLKEITYINCQGIPSGELKHGTISLIDQNALVFAFITDNSLASKTLNVIRQSQSRGGKICLISPFDDVLSDNSLNFTIKLPQTDEQFYPILSVLPMQLLAYYVSVSLGYNPDKPRNLAKSVTVE